VPHDHQQPSTTGGGHQIHVPDEDPPPNVTRALAFLSGTSVIAGSVLLALAALSDCLNAALGAVGGALILAGFIGWLWGRSALAEYRRQIEQARD